MSDRIRRAGNVCWSVVGVTAVLGILAFVGYTVRVIFPPLVLGGAIVFILNPVVTRLHHRGLPRAIGTAIAYLGVIATLALLGVLISPLIQHQADDLSERWPEVRQKVEDRIDEWSRDSKRNNWIIEVPSVKEIEDQLGTQNDDTFTTEFDGVVGDAANELERSNNPVLAADLERLASDAKSRIPKSNGIGERISQIRDASQRALAVGLIFLLGPVIAFYLLVDVPNVRRTAEGLIPERSRREIELVARRLNQAIGGFFRGQLVVALIVGTLVSIGLAIIGLPFWLIVGMIAGLFNIIPLIGPWVGAIPGIIIALTTKDLATAFWVAGIMAGAQQIDNHFISPLVMQRTVKLHPAAVMLALLAGGSLAGFFGLLLAVPTAAVLKIVLGHAWHAYVLGEPIDVLEARYEQADSGPGVGIVEKVGESRNPTTKTTKSTPEVEPEPAGSSPRAVP